MYIFQEGKGREGACTTPHRTLNTPPYELCKYNLLHDIQESSMNSKVAEE